MSNISFGRYTSVLYRYTQIMVNDMLKPYGLGSGQYLFLIALSKNSGISQKDLTVLLNVDKATTAKALSKLENRHYIYRSKNSEDRRYYKIFLTQKGLDFMPILRGHLGQVSDILSNGMSEDEKKLTVQLMEVMIENAIKHVNQMK